MGGFKWCFDGRVLKAYNIKSISKRQRIFEVHVLDLVIDEETGDILEIHIDPERHEAPKLIEYLEGKGLI